VTPALTDSWSWSSIGGFARRYSYALWWELHRMSLGERLVIAWIFRTRPEQGSNRTERIDNIRLSHGVAECLIRSVEVLRCESIANSPFAPISQGIE
jgi:hypothetical protein